ncbi:MAG: hypothetical protein AB8B55_11040 [Mariniblastus sp.]
MPPGLSRFNLPSNAQDVQQLVRAKYSLTSEAAVAFEKLISQTQDGKVEVETVGKSDEGLVSMQVTTDPTTQRAVAEFLKSVFPIPKIDSANFKPTNQSQSVSLKLPAMT